MKKIIVVFMSMILLITGVIASTSEVNAKMMVASSIQRKMLDSLSLDKVDRLMIVAHPDDETIWGGQHILKDRYFIVCITNGNNKKRAKEFEKVMKRSKNPYIMLKYPDKTKGKKDNWKKVKPAIKKDITTLLTYKKWKQVVTHNPDGEYGHQHHKMVSKMVSDVSRKKKSTATLMYFGRYYKKRNIKVIANAKHLSKAQLKAKNRLFAPYGSQMTVKKHLYHMFPYENWISYQDWQKK